MIALPKIEINTVASGLKSPNGIAKSPKDYGSLYVADSPSHKILKIQADGTVSTVAGTTEGNSGDRGLATAAKLQNPMAVVFDSSGNMWIGDTGNESLRTVSASTGRIRTVATGVTILSMAIDSADEVYFYDSKTCKIKKIGADAVVSDVGGTGECGFSGDGGLAVNAQFDEVYGLAIASNGDVYVSDSLNGRIRKIVGGTVYTIAGDPAKAFEPGNALNTSLGKPAGIVIGGRASNLYIASLDGNRILLLDQSVVTPVPTTTIPTSSTVVPETTTTTPTATSTPTATTTPTATATSTPTATTTPTSSTVVPETTTTTPTPTSTPTSTPTTTANATTTRPGSSTPTTATPSQPSSTVAVSSAVAATSTVPPSVPPATSTATATPVAVPAVSLQLGFSAGIRVAEGTAEVTISGDGLQPGSTYRVIMQSSPRQVANGVVGQNGSFQSRIVLPADTPAGAHSLTLSGSSVDGKELAARAYFSVDSSGKVVETSASVPLADPPGTASAPAVNMAPAKATPAQQGAVTDDELALTGASDRAFVITALFLIVAGAALRSVNRRVNRRRIND